MFKIKNNKAMDVSLLCFLSNRIKSQYMDEGCDWNS